MGRGGTKAQSLNLPSLPKPVHHRQALLLRFNLAVQLRVAQPPEQLAKNRTGHKTVLHQVGAGYQRRWIELLARPSQLLAALIYLGRLAPFRRRFGFDPQQQFLNARRNENPLQHRPSHRPRPAQTSAP